MPLEGGGGGHQGLLRVGGQLLAGALVLRQRAAPGVRHAAHGAFEPRGHAVDQRGRAFAEGLGQAVVRAAHVAGQRLGRALVLGERELPGVGHAAGGGLEAGREAVELLLHRLRERVVQRGRLARDAGHGGFDHGLDGRARDARAFGQAVLQRLVDRRGQARIGGLGTVVEVVLPRGKALVQRRSGAPSRPSWPAAGPTSSGMASAWRCSSLNDSSRWCACE
jgi:hypothetical protein